MVLLLKVCRFFVVNYYFILLHATEGQKILQNMILELVEKTVLEPERSKTVKSKKKLKGTQN